MEAMGADVSQKIRSAIKAKLIELGVYIDDELPDYIMVMVANKKSKTQMDEDLLLFLGSNTTKFTSWLHEVLERLQSVTIDAASKKINLLAEPKKETEMKHFQENDGYDIHDEILAIKAEQEEDDLLGEELVTNKETYVAREKKKENTVTPIPRTNVSQRMRPTKRPAPMPLQPIAQKRRIPSSTVGAILTRPIESDDDDDDEDDDDDDVPSGSVASVIKISERRSSVPPSMQANKNLLMRAVAEAKKSVLETTKTPSHHFGENPKQLFTRKYRNLVSSGPCAAAVVRPRKSSVDLSEGFISSPIDKDFIYTEPQIEKETTKRCILVDNNEITPALSPTFIVTLDGVDPSKFSSSSSPLLKGSEDLLELMDDDYEMIVDEVEEEEEEKKEDQVKSNERCKYWPTCKNGNECQYQHPSKQCKTFPNCRFGDKCHYIHPNCKYDATCMRPNCPFTHASRRIVNQMTTPMVFATKLNIGAKDKQQCKFYPNCNNLNCVYFHPRPCRYGLSCTQVGCSFYHPALPSRDKLKWTSTCSTQTPC